MSFTTEAVQCQLGELGVILWPSMTGYPPAYIKDEEIHRLDLRIFPKPNLRGPVFRYTYSAPLKTWVHSVNEINE